MNAMSIYATPNITFTIPEQAIQENPIACMMADTEYKRELAQSSKQKIGMDSLPLIVYNQLIDYSLSNGKLRNAMFLICMANWGCRFSDTVRVRFCHIFDENGKFKESFMLAGGEQKTGKQNIYYNNAAIKKIITMYLKENPREYYDYLFVSESRNKSTKTLREIEIEEVFGASIDNAEKKIKEVAKQKSSLLQLYVKEKITEDELSNELNTLRRTEKELADELQNIKLKSDNYVSNAPNISIQTPMTRAVVEEFMKSALSDLNITIEDKDKKFNTHSLRKLFGEEFYNTGCQLNASGELHIDMAMMKLVQDKFMHSKNSITRRYNQTEERAFREICMAMNLGLSVLNRYC